MTLQAIDTSSINKSLETLIMGQPYSMPLIPRNHTIVAFLSPDRDTRSVPVACENIDDMKKAYKWYYTVPTRRIIWRECELNENLAERTPVDDISELFR